MWCTVCVRPSRALCEWTVRGKHKQLSRMEPTHARSPFFQRRSYFGHVHAFTILLYVYVIEICACFPLQDRQCTVSVKSRVSLCGSDLVCMANLRILGSFFCLSIHARLGIHFARKKHSQLTTHPVTLAAWSSDAELQIPKPDAVTSR